jgi:hypothetical protein
MDAHHFDTLCRTLTTAASRRVITRALAGLAFISPLGALRDPLATGAKKGGKKGKGKKGKPKPKGCGEGQRFCGLTCIPADHCCPSELGGVEECEPCSRKTCVNGTCQCPEFMIEQNGACGYLPRCESAFLPCRAHHECCSASCHSIGAFPDGTGRCDQSLQWCLVNTDCASFTEGCRGFMCPEAFRAIAGLESCF